MSQCHSATYRDRLFSFNPWHGEHAIYAHRLGLQLDYTLQVLRGKWLRRRVRCSSCTHPMVSSLPRTTLGVLFIFPAGRKLTNGSPLELVTPKQLHRRDGLLHLPLDAFAQRPRQAVHLPILDKVKLQPARGNTGYTYTSQDHSDEGQDNTATVTCQPETEKGLR